MNVLQNESFFFLCIIYLFGYACLHWFSYNKTNTQNVEYIVVINNLNNKTENNTCNTLYFISHLIKVQYIFKYFYFMSNARKYKLFKSSICWWEDFGGCLFFLFYNNRLFNWFSSSRFIFIYIFNVENKCFQEKSFCVFVCVVWVLF